MFTEYATRCRLLLSDWLQVKTIANEGSDVVVGNHKLIDQLGVDAGPYTHTAENMRQKGHSVVFVLIDNILAGLLCVLDPIKRSSEKAIRELHKEGIHL